MRNRTRIAGGWGLGMMAAAWLAGPMAPPTPAADNAPVRGADAAIRAVGSAAASPGTAALTLIGADRSIEMIARALTPAAPTPGPATNSPRDQLQQDVDAFRSESDQLPPEQAAERWVALYDRFVALPRQPDAVRRVMFDMSSDDPDAGVSLPGIVRAMPPPPAWPPLAARVAARPKPTARTADSERFLRLFSFYLNGDTAAIRRELDALTKAIDKAESYRRDSLREEVRELSGIVRKMELRAAPIGIVETFRQALAEQQSKKGGSDSEIMVPDLVSLIDPAEATNLIRQALAIPKARLSVPAGPATRALARRVALGQVDTLSSPQWGLVTGMDSESVRLFEAMDRKFGRKPPESDASSSPFIRLARSGSSEDYQEQRHRGAAVGYYAYGLLLANRTNEAVKAAMDMADSGSSYQFGEVRREAARQLPPEVRMAFLALLLKEKPDADAWAEWAATALEARQTALVPPALHAAEARAAKSPALHAKLVPHLIASWLAIDEIDEALRLLRAALAEPPDSAPERPGRGGTTARCDLALRLAQLGRLLGRPDVEQEGLATAEAEVRRAASGEAEYGGYRITQFSNLLIERGEYVRAEALLLAVMTAGQHAAPQSPRSSSARASRDLSAGLKQLLCVYHASGRHADAVALLERAPWWGVGDLAELRDSSGGEVPFASRVGASLHAVGRDDEARRILRDHLHGAPGDDAAYATLVEMDGPALIPWLDALYARDRFEERPLIWKAALLRKAGRLDEAEATARTALKVDPTDGETRAGDRVRGYGVLADILAAKGKGEDAQFFSNVVRSVRMAERGDEFTHAGLIVRSLPLYEQAQGLFADAYCVQWRLAERLAAKGEFEEADKHYRIAFERMPEQFGQVASLCFGCEGVFASRPSRGAAERVLADLIDRGKTRPQVFFLLGQLREAQERLPEAYAAFRKAAEMDPAYLDACYRSYALGEQLFVPSAERDALALRLLAMDPLQRHAHISVDEVLDLKGLWAAVAANRQFVHTPPKGLFELKASRAKLDTAANATDPEWAWRMRYARYSMYDRSGPKTPGEAVASTEFVQKLHGLSASAETDDE